MGTIEREPEVIDNLTSTSAIDALSANQGKVLNEKIQRSVVRGADVGNIPANDYVSFTIPTYNLVSGYVNLQTSPNRIAWIVSRISSVIGGTEIRVMNTSSNVVQASDWTFYYTVLN